MMILFFLIIVSADIPDEFACEAGPGFYGPECQASLATEGGSVTMIVYKITEIVSSTNIECEGRGSANVLKCDDTKRDWYPLGVLTEGDVGSLYWGANIDYPAIKCKGIPSQTGIKWQFYLVDNTRQGCCNKKIFNTTRQRCCGGNLYKKEDYPGYYCCGDNWMSPEDECCKIGDPVTGEDTVCPKGHYCCQANICTNQNICCSNSCNYNGWSVCNACPSDNKARIY
jgi:hypothetical protein